MRSASAWSNRRFRVPPDHTCYMPRKVSERYRTPHPIFCKVFNIKERAQFSALLSLNNNNFNAHHVHCILRSLSQRPHVLSVHICVSHSLNLKMLRIIVGIDCKLRYSLCPPQWWETQTWIHRQTNLGSKLHICQFCAGCCPYCSSKHAHAHTHHVTQVNEMSSLLHIMYIL